MSTVVSCVSVCIDMCLHWLCTTEDHPAARMLEDCMHLNVNDGETHKHTQAPRQCLTDWLLLLSARCLHPCLVTMGQYHTGACLTPTVNKAFLPETASQKSHRDNEITGAFSQENCLRTLFLKAPQHYTHLKLYLLKHI